MHMPATATCPPLTGQCSIYTSTLPPPTVSRLFPGLVANAALSFPATWSSASCSCRAGASQKRPRPEGINAAETCLTGEVDLTQAKPSKQHRPEQPPNAQTPAVPLNQNPAQDGDCLVYVCSLVLGENASNAEHGLMMPCLVPLCEHCALGASRAD